VQELNETETGRQEGRSVSMQRELIDKKKRNVRRFEMGKRGLEKGPRKRGGHAPVRTWCGIKGR